MAKKKKDAEDTPVVEETPAIKIESRDEIIEQMAENQRKAKAPTVKYDEVPCGVATVQDHENRITDIEVKLGLRKA